ncbi:hypothetical protein [Paracoccus sp. 22332]|uniref:hypothetical protein n=1 Tax=Paracoccus sp. 22332 TaxID=3453913 RepID=UPI003F8767E7
MTIARWMVDPVVCACMTMGSPQVDMEMNLQLHHVVSDITGTTGMRIIRAIVAGEHDPEVLAAFRDIRCHASAEVIKAALVGNDRDEHIFALSQSLDLYDLYQVKIEECDRKLEAAVAGLTVKAIGDVPALPKARIKRKQVNAPSFDVRAAFMAFLAQTSPRSMGWVLRLP